MPRKFKLKTKAQDRMDQEVVYLYEPANEQNLADLRARLVAAGETDEQVLADARAKAILEGVPNL